MTATTEVPIRPAAALRRLAAELDTPANAPLSQQDMVRALHLTTEGRERQAALNLLNRHLRHAPSFGGCFFHWTGPKPRADVVALVREAAELAEAVARG